MSFSTPYQLEIIDFLSICRCVDGGPRETASKQLL